MSKPIQLFWPAFKSVSLVTNYTKLVAAPVRFNEVSYEVAQYGGLMTQGDGALSQSGGWHFKGFQTHLLFTAAGDLSSTNFRIEGTDLFGAFVTEDIPGPNAGSVSTTYQYATVTSIVSDDTVAGLTVQNDVTGRTAYIFADYNRSNWSASVQVECASTDVTPTFLAFNVYGTCDPLLSNQRALTQYSVPTPYAQAKLITSSNIPYYLLNLTSPRTAIWADITGGNIGRSLTLTFLQQGLRS